MTRLLPSSNTILKLSAVALAGLIVVQLCRPAPAGDRPSNAALASALAGGMDGGVGRVGDYTVLTFNAGNDDVLAVLDGRGEELFFYRVRNLMELEFLGREPLPGLFAAGRKLGPGRK